MAAVLCRDCRKRHRIHDVLDEQCGLLLPVETTPNALVAAATAESLRLPVTFLASSNQTPCADQPFRPSARSNERQAFRVGLASLQLTELRSRQTLLTRSGAASSGFRPPGVAALHEPDLSSRRRRSAPRSFGKGLGSVRASHSSCPPFNFDRRSSVKSTAESGDWPCRPKRLIMSSHKQHQCRRRAFCTLRQARQPANRRLGAFNVRTTAATNLLVVSVSGAHGSPSK
jgi:hypothetical protein